MPTSVTAYFTNGTSACLKGFVNLNTPANSILRMAEVSSLLGHACELLIDEPGYTAYGQENAADWARLNPIAKTPDGQELYGNVLVIEAS